MLDPVGDDNELAFFDHFFTVAEFHHQSPAMNEEQFVFAFVEMPREVPFKLRQFDLHIIYLTRNAGRPCIRKSAKSSVEAFFTERREVPVKVCHIPDDGRKLSGQCVPLGRIVAIQGGGADGKARRTCLFHRADTVTVSNRACDDDGLSSGLANRSDERGNVR